MRFRVPAAIGLSACVIVHATQSGAAREEWPTKGWPSAAPQEVGLDPKPLNALDADIAGGKYGNVDSMLVIRHGRLAFDRSYKHDYDRVYGEEARNLPGRPSLSPRTAIDRVLQAVTER